MKKTVILIFIVLISFSFGFADTLKSTSEIYAIKTYHAAASGGTPQEEPPTITSFVIYQGQNKTTVVSDNGGKAYETNEIPDSSFVAFYWTITGTAFREIDVSFTFGPLYAGNLEGSASVTRSDYDLVIPYSVKLEDDGYTKVGNDNLSFTTPITYYNKDSAKHTSTTTIREGNNNRNVTIYYVDKKQYSNNEPQITTEAKTVLFKGDMSANSDAFRRNSSTSYKSYINTCDEWTRSGKGTVTINLNTLSGGSDGYYWIDADDERHDISSGAYKANVIVTITSGS